MWYGQSRDGNGQMRSFARHLDIIAHELAHGVTEFTANLVYLRQSGALNESFSDIFGVIIKNWDWGQPDTGGDAMRWDWEIGRGLGKGGLPLRDMSDPSRTDDPDHMNKYFNTAEDNGGVHTNSNIHNKAAYNVFTAINQAGSPVFTPRDVAVLYYLALTRLDKLATFAQTKATLLNVAGTYFAGDPSRQEKLDAISSAYAQVGI
jgi:Zn-dependent metalloprotease